jgi:predicted TIM-barrel fold metal-dependent hydrolase
MADNQVKQNIRIVDAHIHLLNNNAEFEHVYDLAKKLDYERMTVLSLQSSGLLLQNHLCALFKHVNKHRAYAFGGLEYVSGRDCRTQVENLYNCGFDGIKMLEGKPTARREIKLALDDPSYDPYYNFCEEKGFPILMHIADPATFWDREKVPDWALKEGWFYGEENDVPYEKYYEEVNNVLKKHPKLRVIFAHFYFLSGNPDKLQQFLDEHPNIFIDVTAGVEMYEDFSKDPDFWRDFFIKNQERIIFGTDATDEKITGGGLALSGYAGMEVEFLKNYKPVEIYDYKLHGIGLPYEEQEKIFALNYLELVKEPRKLDIDRLVKEGEFLRGFVKDEKDLQLLEELLTKLGRS